MMIRIYIYFFYINASQNKINMEREEKPEKKVEETENKKKKEEKKRNYLDMRFAYWCCDFSDIDLDCNLSDLCCFCNCNCDLED
jgi:hypothetical protein